MLSVPEMNAAPTTYDQRQTGEVNVDAKLENFLVIIATSGSSSLFGSLASQALELNELISQRGKQQNRNRESKPSEMVIYETEDADGGRQPYHVEIVHIENEGDATDANKRRVDVSSDVETIEKIQLRESSKVISEESSDDGKIARETSVSRVPGDSKTEIKKIRSLWETEAIGRRLGDGPMEGKKTADVKDTQRVSLDRNDQLPVKHETAKVIRPGILLKKQLSKDEEEEEEKNAAPLSEERNELGNGYKDQLVLIGDGIENCGPGRYRDRTGICQDDESFN